MVSSLPPCPHPLRSVNFGNLEEFESPWVVYAEMMSTSAVYLRDSTMVWRAVWNCMGCRDGARILQRDYYSVTGIQFL